MKIRRVEVPKGWLRYVLAAAVILAAGFAVDFFCQRDVLSLPAEEKGVLPLGEELWQTEGLERTEEGWMLSEEGGALTLELSGRFVGRLGFSYGYNERLDAVWYVWEPGAAEPIRIEDHNSALIQTSVERLDRPVERVRIEWMPEGLWAEAGEEERTDEAAAAEAKGESDRLRIRSAFIVNSFELNWHRLLFVWTILGLAAFLWLGRRFIIRHLEAGFLAVALSLGILMIVLAPANKVSWDEETHFFHTWCVSHFGLEVRTNDMLERLFVADKENYPYNLPANLDERREMNEALNEGAREECIYSRGHALAGIYTPAYIPAAVGLRLGLLLRLPFTTAYQLGRLFNLLFCACVLAWAIRKLPIGKAVLTVIGLLPTPLFLMSMYSYDAFLTSLLALGFAWFLDEYLHRERKISWFGFGVMAFCFAAGAMPKAIYAPLILVVFLLPREKFADRRQELCMKGLAAVLFAALMASFVLPTVLSPAESNDTRGGNTSEAGQIPYILSDIPRFLRMLISSIRTTFPGYTIGAAVYGTMGHLGFEMLGMVIPVFVLGVLFADEKRIYGAEVRAENAERNRKDEEGKKREGLGRRAGRLGWLARGWILLLCAGIMAMVWVAMYLAFTPVGENYIQGVQARYYIPLLLPVYLCLCPDAVKVRVSREWVYMAALGGAAVITAVGVGRAMLILCG